MDRMYPTRPCKLAGLLFLDQRAQLYSFSSVSNLVFASIQGLIVVRGREAQWLCKALKTKKLPINSFRF